MNHLKDYTVEQIVTDLGLYQSVRNNSGGNASGNH